jgi:hypothetical protein
MPLPTPDGPPSRRIDVASLPVRRRPPAPDPPSAPDQAASGAAAAPTGGGASVARDAEAAVEEFNTRILRQATRSAESIGTALERDRRLHVVLYVVLFTVGVGTAVAAIVQGLLAESVGEAVAGLGIAGLSAASFFAFFLARPLEALERNAIYTQWLAATVTAYWTRMVFLDDPDMVDAEIRAATTDLVGDLDKLARRHAAATARAAVPQAPAAGP